MKFTIVSFCFQNHESNLKNHHHEFHNIQQYILQIQKEKCELQSQLVALVQNADAKRQEIERLHKELKHLKDRYCFDNKQSEEQQSPSSIEIDGKDRNDLNKNSGSDLKNESGVGESPLKTIDQSVTGDHLNYSQSIKDYIILYKLL